MTNKEKLLAFVSEDKNSTLEHIKYRVEDRERLRKEWKEKCKQIDTSILETLICHRQAYTRLHNQVLNILENDQEENKS